MKIMEATSEKTISEEKIEDTTFSMRIFGLDNCLHALIASFNREKVHHGVILAGSSAGIGKTTLALRIAFTVLVGAELDTEQYNNLLQNITQPNFAAHLEKLSIYKQFVKLQHPDFLLIRSDYKQNSTTELKKKKTIDIGEVHQIRHFLKLTPAISQWRVVVIEGAENMNHNAANALLKTLEEPGKFTLIILVSHNLQKIIPTIRSRCRITKVPRLQFKDFCAALQAICKGNQDMPCVSEGDCPFLYKLSEGNLDFTIKCLKMGFEKVKTLVTKALNAKMDEQDLAQFKKHLKEEQVDTIEIFTRILEYTLYERLKKLVIAQGASTPEVTKYFDNFAKVRKVLNDSTYLNLDLGNVIFSLVGIR
jgi:DNA polymerase III delta prime subunit